jgi:glycosyltransferase involved in cell wall biosynthesis
MDNTKKPLVSICCITYNQEKFIRDTINGFLMQKTFFPIEIIIHDDCSTDNTPDIILEYVDQHPELIKPIFQNENQYSLGRKIFPIVFSYAKGEYIAICEGDDYWTDPNKLQRQVDFMKRFPEYVLVAENAIYHNMIKDTKKKFSELPERDIGILEMLDKRQFATASVLFRNIGEKIYYGGDASGDTILWCHLSKFGKIRYMEYVSSVYRRHSEGLSGGDIINWSKKMVDWNNTLSQNHPDIDPSVFKKRILDLFKRAVSGLMTNKLYKQALLSIDELIETTAEPSEYKEELYGYVEELLMQKDNSWSMKIGHAVTKPVKVMLQLKGKLFRST